MHMIIYNNITYAYNYTQYNIKYVVVIALYRVRYGK